jgi:hypothetical protein
MISETIIVKAIKPLVLKHSLPSKNETNYSFCENIKLSSTKKRVNPPVWTVVVISINKG